MANPETLADLRARALDYADMTNSAFPVTARVNDYINDGLSALHDILVDSYADYLRSTTTFNVTTAAEAYTLPSDFYKCLKVYYQSSNRRYKVHQFNPDELDGFKTTPITTGTFEMWYIPQFTKLSSDGDTVHLSVPIRWENFVALHAAIQLLNREESDPSALMRERDAERQRMIKLAGPRDAGEVGQVADTYHRFSVAGRYIAPPERSFRYRIMGNEILFNQCELIGA